MGCETVGHLQQRLTVVAALSFMSLAASGPGKERACFKNYILILCFIKFGAVKDDKLLIFFYFGVTHQV